jgi:oligosaccharide repeat unit polymerase
MTEHLAHRDLELLHAWDEQYAVAETDYLPRSPFMPLPFLAPVAIAGFSWISGGLPVMTDVAFLLLTLLCVVNLVLELHHFSRRFGTGGLVLFGGVLIWFCYDYFKHWFGAEFSNIQWVGPDIIAKAAFFHCLLVQCMTVGLLLPWGRVVEKLFYKIREPAPEAYFTVILVMLAIGFSPYFVPGWTRESLPSVLYKLVTFQGSYSIAWNVGRSGNLNTNWGGYVAEILNVGGVGALLGMTYAILVSKSWGQRIFLCLVYLHFLASAFYSGRRGQIIYFALPPLVLLFLKYHAQVAEVGRRYSKRAYILAAAIGFAVLLTVQTQITFRARGLSEVDLDQVSITDVEGNNMFSEGLLGYARVPDETGGFFGDYFPGSRLIMPVPELVFWAAIHPIPRAAWPGKPYDRMWEWYNTLTAGTGTSGTTVSKGLVGWWYFRFGMMGVIQGGLVFGLIMRVAERALQNAQGRVIVIMLSLGITTWLLRCYRDVGFLELYTLLVGVAGLWLVARFFGSTRQ